MIADRSNEKVYALSVMRTEKNIVLNKNYMVERFNKHGSKKVIENYIYIYIYNKWVILRKNKIFLIKKNYVT